MESKEVPYLEEEYKKLYTGNFSGIKCSVQVLKTGEYCPEKPMKEINGLPVCNRCFDNWTERSTKIN